MKRIVILLALVAMLAGCAFVPEIPQTQPDNTTVTTAPTTEPTTAPTTEPTTVPTETVFVPDVSPDVVGIYIPAEDGTKARKLITEFTAKRTAKKDIDCFEIFASQEELLTGRSFSAIWKEAWEQHEGQESAKIGFIIEFSLTGGKNVRAQLLKPSDSADFFEYLEIYMYDDIHQTPGVWYTHLEDGDMDEETIISSIKLTSGSKIAEVGDIILTAFIYDGADNFDANGDYIGEVLQTIVIKE